MERLYQELRENGVYYAAELIVNRDRELIYRYSKAWTEYAQNAVMTPYDGGKLYPCGRSIYTNAQNRERYIRPNFSYTCNVEWEKPGRPAGLKKEFPEAERLLRQEMELIPPWETPHTVGVAGYTHSFINFRRFLADSH